MSPSRPGSQLDRRDRRGVWFAVIGLVVLLGGLYVAGHFLIGNRLPTGARIGGVGVGGLTPEQAEERLAADLGPRTKKKLTFYFEEREFTIEPRDVGLDLRIEDSVAEAGGGRTWNPVRMLETVVGADRIDPVVGVDEQRLQSRIDDIAGDIDVSPAEPRVWFRDKRLKVRKPEAGREVQQDQLARLIREEFVQEREPVQLPVVVDKPDVTGSELERDLRKRVQVAVSAPIKVRSGEHGFELSADAVRSMLSYESEGGRLTAKIDQGRLEELVAAKSESFRRAPRPATVVLRNGSPTAVPDKPGRGVGTDGASAAVKKAIERKAAAERVVKLGVTAPRSDFRKADAQRLGIRQRIGAYSIGYPKSQYIHQSWAARLVDGTVLRPDEVFALSESMGGRSLGDLSPVATALFNGAFVSGLAGVERHPHQLYASHYPAGRDAVGGNGTDLRFANDSKYGVLVHVWVEQGAGTGTVHVALWSTKRWTVQVDVGARHDIQNPVRVEHGKKCVPRPGVAGFGIDLHRTLLQDGEQVRQDTVSTSYQPQPGIRCRRSPQGGDR